MDIKLCSPTRIRKIFPTSGQQRGNSDGSLDNDFVLSRDYFRWIHALPASRGRPLPAQCRPPKPTLSSPRSIRDAFDFGRSIKEQFEPKIIKTRSFQKKIGFHKEPGDDRL